MRAADPERTTLAPGLDLSRVLTGLWQVADMERTAGTRPRGRRGGDGPTSTPGSPRSTWRTTTGRPRKCRALRATPRPGPSFTKWVPEPRPVTREDVAAAVTARSRGSTERIDLLQFHAWTYADPGWLDALFFLDELRGEGLIGQLGLTNFDTAHLRIAVSSGIPIVSNQVAFSLLDSARGGRMSAFCRERACSLLAYGTVAGGWLRSAGWSARARLGAVAAPGRR